MIKDYEIKYKELLKDFLEKLPEEIPFGMPCPMIPCVGNLYDEAKTKIAFFGMETNGWKNLYKLKGSYINENIDAAFEYLIDLFHKKTFINWTNHFHTSFWDYILMFLSQFYNLDKNFKFTSNGEDFHILESFIWGNTNALERYHVTAQKNNVEYGLWNKIKELSRKFDSAEYIIETCKPDVMIILHWRKSKSWILGKKKVKPEIIGDHLHYYYLEDNDTHVYWLAHPAWMSRKKQFKPSIEKIINHLKTKDITGNYNEVLTEKSEDHKAEALTIS